ncbi:MAG: hypothetical protein JOZ17_13960 [Acetobacteraceae bacterium]|nr:hypothetical protein [Acetobacteraceae bacterium]
MNKPWTKTYGPGVPLEIDADGYPSMVALFERAAAEYADQAAFECFGRTMTYAVPFTDIVSPEQVGCGPD